MVMYILHIQLDKRIVRRQKNFKNSIENKTVRIFLIPIFFNLMTSLFLLILQINFFKFIKKIHSIINFKKHT